MDQDPMVHMDQDEARRQDLWIPIKTQVALCALHQNAFMKPASLHGTSPPSFCPTEAHGRQQGTEAPEVIQGVPRSMWA